MQVAPLGASLAGRLSKPAGIPLGCIMQVRANGPSFDALSSCPEICSQCIFSDAQNAEVNVR